MEYLVESHMGSFYYISDESPKEIKKTDPESGDADTILLSWKEGRKIDVLEEYFSGIRKPSSSIKRMYKNGLSKESISDVINCYYDDDEKMIIRLLKCKIITEEEAKHLLKVNGQYREKQDEVFKEVKEPKTLKLKK